MDGFRHFAHGVFKKAVETVTSPLSTSHFEDKKVLTPEEFVKAGDYLVRACPTWSWESGDVKKRRSYFPPDKQYLVTRGVPCLSRATEFEQYNPNSEYALGGDEEGWVATHKAPVQAGAAAATPDTEGASSSQGPSTSGATSPQPSPANADDDIPDISELELGAANDEAALSPIPSGAGYLNATEPSNIMLTRTYDLYITYDQYYQVPRTWLVGYDENRQPLTPQQVLEDVSEEHARKTITVDPHPHLSITAASIHPCRHADVMKRLVDNLTAAGKEFPVSHYLVLFLKFIACVVPTIQYDYTMSVGG
mmetsp:Transcript_2151/g.3487  ORF Transcript_2151/g.3487 Transcript_2151/m.3487 type:complete len:308 (+) Transcript_2151:85-1008(+)|eukprot:CAMPEP_0119103154 /NCGR_PEP_ID=MMETSP1180-20130426/1678_1 /TAXON_ID=3052 ORGANISM="Chlamydomonas cf sp, Strain CCMP681" /NCGR_SAMPLE_ID=MMETSP1180 /ASSEMBLY_ACC=CAM_ASM_000741 /LENGTH=307 /DNA_ID=CAMNT_0007087599 /DNA_START=72 /DNA_END=995 /DNA_ORIENTATION=-